MTALSGCCQITTVLHAPPVIATRLEPPPEIRSVLAVGQGPSGPPGLLAALPIFDAAGVRHDVRLRSDACLPFFDATGVLAPIALETTPA